IERAAVTVSARRRVPEVHLDEAQGEKAFRHRREKARSADRLVEEARDGKGNVTNPFRLDAKAGPAGQKAVSRVALEELRRHLRALAISRGAANEAVERLEAPAALHELDREPIQELRVRGLRGAHAKVLRGLDEASAKV